MTFSCVWEATMPEREFLDGISRIYRSARDSDDGARCMVAPHPDLRARIKSAIAAMAATGGLPPALHLRAAEPRALGLNDGVIIPPEEFAAGTSPSVVRSAAARAAGPLRGTVRVIVVLVDFSDRQMVQTRQHFQDLFFSLGQPKKSVREYYRDVTHGLIDLQGDVIGPLRLSQTVKTYANGASGMGRASPNAQTMAFDAVSVADPLVDFTPFDNDGNGFVDAFIVIHAGSGGEVTGNSDDIWSHKWVLPGGARAVDRTRIFAYLTVPEDCKIGVCAHELGHLLFGFPDLYDTDGSSEGIGNWCLMAAGSWGGVGDKPAHPSAWCDMDVLQPRARADAARPHRVPSLSTTLQAEADEDPANSREDKIDPEKQPENVKACNGPFGQNYAAEKERDHSGQDHPHPGHPLLHAERQDDAHDPRGDQRDPKHK